MRRQMQISLDTVNNHHALRRCVSCGMYTRPYDEVNGAIRCERCAKRARSDGKEEPEEDLSASYLIR
jgi:hypothetical protein